MIKYNYNPDDFHSTNPGKISSEEIPARLAGAGAAMGVLSMDSLVTYPLIYIKHRSSVNPQVTQQTDRQHDKLTDNTTTQQYNHHTRRHST